MRTTSWRSNSRRPLGTEAGELESVCTPLYPGIITCTHQPFAPCVQWLGILVLDSISHLSSKAGKHLDLWERLAVDLLVGPISGFQDQAMTLASEIFLMHPRSLYLHVNGHQAHAGFALLSGCDLFRG